MDINNINFNIISNIVFHKFDSNMERDFYLSIIGKNIFIFDDKDIEVINHLKNNRKLNDKVNDLILRRYRKYSEIGIIKNKDSKDEKIKNNKSIFLIKKIIINEKITEKICLKLKFLFNNFIYTIIILYLIFIIFYFIINYNSIKIILLNGDYLPIYILIPIVYLGMLFHEFGHSSALTYFGQKPKGIGIGLYYYFFIFYSDLTNAWYLKRKERILINLSGFIFQILYFMLINIFCVLFYKSMLQRIYVFIILEVISIMYNFNPFLKFDGYWVLSDSLGIPNLSDFQGKMTKYLIYDFFNLLKKNYGSSKFKIGLSLLKKNIRLLFILYLFLSNIFYMTFYIMIFITIFNLSDDYFFSVLNYINKIITDKKLIFNNSILNKILFLVFVVIFFVRIIKQIINKVLNNYKKI